MDDTSPKTLSELIASLENHAHSLRQSTSEAARRAQDFQHNQGSFEPEWRYGCERTELIDALFDQLDADRDHRLKWHEMQAFMSHLWQSDRPLNTKAYVQLCRELRVPPQQGLDRCHFAAFLDEHVESGCHCTNVELAGLLALATQHAGWPRDRLQATSGGA